jgi:hypothetical protein
MFTMPLAGAKKLALQVIGLPAAMSAGGVGAQLMVAPAGKPVAPQVMLRAVVL